MKKGYTSIYTFLRDAAENITLIAMVLSNIGHILKTQITFIHHSSEALYLYSVFLWILCCMYNLVLHPMLYH